MRNLICDIKEYQPYPRVQGIKDVILMEGKLE
jgi:hypothetical protein